MLIPQGDGTYVMGPLDAIFIWRHVETGRFHPVIFEERPFPGPVQDVEEMAVVRLKSKAHHTVGYESLAEAQAGIAEMRQKLFVEDECVFADDPLEWDGTVESMIVPNWRLVKA